jgi:hypothetical protein
MGSLTDEVGSIFDRRGQPMSIAAKTHLPRICFKPIGSDLFRPALRILWRKSNPACCVLRFHQERRLANRDRTLGLPLRSNTLTLTVRELIRPR